MAASPEWKVYDRNATYQAACKEIEAAAALMGFYGEGATIRYEHSFLVWTEGRDGTATESYDVVATMVYERVAKINQKFYARVHGS